MGFIYAVLFVVLLIVILNWNPELGATTVTAEDKKAVQKTYRWLRTSSFLTIPSCLLLLIYFEFTTSYRDQLHYRVVAATLPLVWHSGLLLRLRTKNLFVFRHTQQALALLILRAALAALFAVNIDNGGLFWFFVFNGFFWFFGSWWGNRQLKRNTCWLMTRKREGIFLVGEASAAKIICSSCGKPLVDTDVFCPHCGHAFAVPKSALAETYLDEGLRLFVEENNKEAATKKLLRAFQAGTPDIRQRAVEALSKLGAVEKF